MEQNPEDAALSNCARTLWAKTDLYGGDGWLPLYQHMADSAEVARLLWREWVGGAIQRLVIDHVGNEDVAEALVVWMAAAHDLGKATPGFQFGHYGVNSQIRCLADRVHESGLPVPRGVTADRPPYHALMSQALLYDWLKRAHAWNGLAALTYAIVPGGHHGIPPEYGQMDSLLGPHRSSDNLGLTDWVKVQDELANYAANISGVRPFLPELSQRSLPPTLQMVLTGLVIVADWIASNGDLCPLFPTLRDTSARQRADDAWKSLRLPSAWHPGVETAVTDAHFQSRFPGMAPKSSLRPAQRMVADAARSISRPGLFILEAPMGSGKTEAALLAAEVIAARFGQGGVAFLLPTMATSNAMFSRIHAWINQVPDTRGHQAQSVQLAHGKAALNPEYANLKPWKSWSMGEYDLSGSAAEVAIAHGWLTGHKRSLLSSFVVGTVDQLLMAGLKAKHVVLRHLGLAGKVVIIDEVHAYDAYMSVYLDRVLSWLGAYHVPVILLSATLPPSRREDMIRAYSGAGRKPSPVPAAPRTSAGEPAYPMLAVVDGPDVRYATCQEDGRTLTVALEEMPDDDETLVQRLREVMVDGGCVGVIRNTVRRAQATYSLLRDQLDAEVVLNHARFIACDRMAKDAELVQRLGRDAEERPKRLVVVGTQVLEQSLDIDFDLMVSDIAPVDLLLQRIGRLHRHPKWDSVRPDAMRQARCLLTAVNDWAATPPVLDRGTEYVYQPALVWRTIAALREEAIRRGGQCVVELPADIAPLVEGVYEGRIIMPPAWNDALAAAITSMNQERDSKKNRAEIFLLPSPPRPGHSVTGLLRADLKDADDDNQRGQAAVRDTEDSIEVLIVQRAVDGRLQLLPWVADLRSSQQQKLSAHVSTLTGMEKPDVSRELATDLEPDPEAARLAATCTVALPRAMNWQADSVIRALELAGGYSGWQQSPWLRGQLPLVVDDQLTAVVRTPGNQFRLRYDQNLGLLLLPKEEMHE